METDSNEDGWPEDWARVPQATWEKEEGNAFVRLKSETPGSTVLIFQKVPLPKGVEALKMKWRQRIPELKLGSKAWFDARIMLEFRDTADQRLASAPPAPFARKPTAGWVEREVEFLVPEGADSFVFMPTLFQVESGTFDLDDFSITPTEAAPLREKAEAAAQARAAKAAAMAQKQQAIAAATLAESGSLIVNGDFETTNAQGDWPQHWGGKKSGLSWETEEGNSYMRLVVEKPGDTQMLYRVIPLPAGTRALELTWRQRITGLKNGLQPWFDARILLEFQDIHGKVLPKKPPHPNTRKDTPGWVQKSATFLVPEEAISLVMMPSLFQVRSGTLELDDIVLKQADAEVLIAEAKLKEERLKARQVPPEEPHPSKWPKELRVQGNRLVDPEGKEAWLQGVHVVSLEWNPRGEDVLLSIKTAIEDWKANVIRLSITDGYWNDEKTGADYKKLVDQAVILTANRGAYIVLDNHRYRAVRPEHIPFWKELAGLYKNHPAVLFDLINEPHTISWDVWRNGGFVEERNTKADEDAFLSDEEKAKAKAGFESPGMQSLLEAVRATGAKNIVIAGALDWAYDLSGILKGYALEDKTGNGVMYAAHIYPWKSKWQEKVLDIAAVHPIFVGEVGADAKKMEWMPADQQEDAETWVPDILGLIQKYRLNWTAFSFHPSASPRMLSDWDYTPTPFWGAPVKRALSGEQFELKKLR
jgi:hypothetical protein